jgi:hypothetical protein
MRDNGSMRARFCVTFLVGAVLVLSSAFALLMISLDTIAAGLPAKQASVSQVNEKKLEKNIAGLVEAIRRQNGLREFGVIRDSKLRQDACESAKGDKEYGRSSADDAGIVVYPFDRVDDVGNLSTFSYTTSNPGQLPHELQVWTTKPTYDDEALHRLGVGVCFVRTLQHPDGVYGIDIGYYMGAAKTFLYRVTGMWE